MATPSTGSPGDNFDSVNSINSTPIVRASKSYSSSSPGQSSKDDPFVIKTPKKLSAKAPEFMPTTNGANSMIAIKTSRRPAPVPEALPDLAQMLRQRIAEAGCAPNSSPTAATDTRFFTFGIFSFDNEISRTLKISSDLPGIVVTAAIRQTLTVSPNMSCRSAAIT